VKTYELQCDDAPAVRFVGDLIGSAANSWDRAASDFSGSTGRCMRLQLYKTPAGKFVCHRIRETLWQGEHDLYETEVCSTEAEVIAFFGHSRLAKELYEDAEIDAARTVE
jgi:hypothetical protein